MFNRREENPSLHARRTFAAPPKSVVLTLVMIVSLAGCATVPPAAPAQQTAEQTATTVPTAAATATTAATDTPAPTATTNPTSTPAATPTTAPPTDTENSITILPIDGARFIAGQRFDFRVEVGKNLPDFTDPTQFKVTIGGQPLQTFFGKEPDKSNALTTTAELTVRQVSFDTPGQYVVEVEAAGKTAKATYEVIQPQAESGKAKNVILFIGDGMAWPSLTIARIVSKGLKLGHYNGLLEMDQMDEVGYVTTSGYDSLVTDSANAASAYGTGHKSVVNAMGVYEDNTADPMDDPRVENIIEIVKRSRQMATGLVATSEIEDATPAAMFVHTRRRAEKQYVADQLLDDPLHQPDVILGGGSAYFIPKSTAGSKRKDERNLLEDFMQAGYAVVGTRTELSATTGVTRLLGLFHPDNMNVWVDREYTKDPDVLGPYTDQPPLYEMTAKAIDLLANSPNGKQNGFFLMVEGSSVDKQFHPMDWERGIGDLLEMDKALAVAKEFAARNEDTLIIVTADHSHSISVFGTYDATKGPGQRDAVGIYNTAKFPTFEDRGDGFPVTWSPSRTLAIGFGNHPDYTDDFIFNPKPLSPTVRDPNNKDADVYIPNPEHDPQGITLTGNLPLYEGTEVHSADDVPLFASGPGARYFHGIHDNTDIFLGIMNALELDATITAAKP